MTRLRLFVLFAGLAFVSIINPKYTKKFIDGYFDSRESYLADLLKREPSDSNEKGLNDE